MMTSGMFMLLIRITTTDDDGDVSCGSLARQRRRFGDCVFHNG